MATKLTSKDIKTVDDIDFENMELIRGDTPEDIKQKCYDLCRDYLGGVWLKVSIDETEVKRLSGGLTNQLYYCGISGPFKPIADEPQEVAIRLYGAKHYNNLDCDGNERLTDVIIGLLVSEYKLGPKIYGLFESGQIQKYYKHIQFRVDQQNDPKLVKELSKKLARVHAMAVPIKKSGNWIFQMFDTFYDIAYKNFPINDLIEECNCQTLKKYDLKQELEWMKRCILKSNSPIVFCHNDFRGSNIMKTESENNNIDNENTLVFCDFEYSSYGYRGVDFGTIFAEWGRPMSELTSLHNFPEDSVIKPFIEEYISESIKIEGKKYSAKKLNSIEQILKEIKVFTLFANIFMVVFCFKIGGSEGDLPMDKKLSMQFSEVAFQNYIHLKQKFIREKAIHEN